MPEGNDPAAVARAMSDIRKQIEEMCAAQREAITNATYLGLTAEDAKSTQERRAKIAALFQEYLRLHASV